LDEVRRAAEVRYDNEDGFDGLDADTDRGFHFYLEGIVIEYGTDALWRRAKWLDLM
jgi:hypothetical protein